MKISFIGTGKLATNLGRLFFNAGHEVFFSSRNPELKKGSTVISMVKAEFGNHKQAAEFGEIVILAIPYLVSIHYYPD